MDKIEAYYKVRDVLPLVSHTRTSCDDTNSNGNEYFNEFGIPRCPRCAMLHFLTHGKWPHGARLIEFKVNVDIELE